MRDVEQDLRSLGAGWAAPETPDIAAAVAGRLPATPLRRRLGRRVRVALVAAAVALGTVAAVAPAREAVLDFFDVGSVRVTSGAPPLAPAGVPQDGLGRAVTPAEAEAAAGAPVRVPVTATLGPPDDTYLQLAARTPVVTSVWRDDRGGIDVLLTQAQGSLLMQKFVDPAHPPNTVDLGDARAFWFAGGPHTFGFLDRAGDLVPQTTRLADNVLLWDADGVTFRLEGVASLPAAVAIARTLR